MASSSVSARMTAREYFTLPETNRPSELVYGVVREPPAPAYGHQKVIGALFRLLSAHVEENGLGEVCVSPVDVVLDEVAGLVVQPDLIFISNERLSIIQQHVSGAPDLVIEVLSPSTAHRDRTIKLAWYRRYGVRECWLVDPHQRTIDIVDCGTGARESFTATQMLRSRVLPGLAAAPDDVFVTRGRG